MPLTPLHLGSGLFLRSLSSKFNLWAVLLGSIIMDIEPLVLILILRCYQCPHHAFFHSVFGAVFGSLVLASLLYKFKGKLDKISQKIKIKNSFSFPILFFSSLSAWLIHILFDSLTHRYVFIFWPFKYNPILIGPKAYWPLNLILLVLGIIGLVIIYKKIKKQNHA